MIPAPFGYVRAGSADEAVALLAEHGDDARLLAGGHSLLPQMKLRLVAPTLLVDIGPCRELAGVADDGDHLVIGALTRHHDLAASALVHEHAPILARAAGLVGDPQVRHRGTLGGSLAQGDPAGDLPGAVLALGGAVVARSPRGERTIPATALFTACQRTLLAPDELLTAVRVPKVGGAGWSYQRIGRRAHDWPLVAVAVVRHPACGVALVHMGPTPMRATAVEAALAAGATAAEAAALAGDGDGIPADTGASAEYRRHLARVLARRALEAAGA